MLKYLVPRIALTDLPSIIGFAVFGAILAGIYGILHDQVTYSIGPEYFTKLKFKQFGFADFGFGDRIFVSFVGFLATWWAGFFVAWFLSRRLIPKQQRSTAFRKILAGFTIVFACGFAAGLGGYCYGIWRGPKADFTAWQSVFSQYDITDSWAFVRVAYIHNASYLGGLFGFLVALYFIRPEDESVISDKAT